jgi:hypothetical protein
MNFKEQTALLVGASRGFGRGAWLKAWPGVE